MSRKKGDGDMIVKRREFLCACAAGAAALGPKALFASKGETLSMADMTGKHLTMGFWSADSLLLSAAKYLKEPEDIVRLATGFGGGMGQKNLCGFLTGGFMAIGLFAGPTKGSDKASRQKCQNFCKEYFDWWSQNYKLTCKEIGSPCNYKEMGIKSSEFLQKLFERELKKTI